MGIEDQLVGMTIDSEEYDFPVLDTMVMYDGDDITTPVGENAIDWLQSLPADFDSTVDMDRFDAGS